MERERERRKIGERAESEVGLSLQIFFLSSPERYMQFEKDAATYLSTDCLGRKNIFAFSADIDRNRGPGARSCRFGWSSAHLSIFDLFF